MSNRPVDEKELQELARTLATLSLSDFVEVFRMVSEAIGAGRDRPDDAGWDIGGGAPLQRLALAVAFVDAEVTAAGGIEDASCHVELVAYPTAEGRCALRPEGARGPTAGLWESGACPRCGSDLCSQVKTALCPVCSAEAALT